MSAAIERRHEHRDILPDHVRPGISENMFSRRIYGLDYAFFVYGNNSIDCRVHDGFKLRFALYQGAFGFLLLGNVQRSAVPQNCPVLV